MSKLFKKLNLKDQNEILVLNSPQTFEAELDQLKEIHILRDLEKIELVNFVLVFVKTAEEIDQLTLAINEKAPGDPLVWFAYPKKSSKKYKVEINRDQGWDALDKVGFQPVRQVAIDEDWSALRFRRKENVGH